MNVKRDICEECNQEMESCGSVYQECIDDDVVLLQCSKCKKVKLVMGYKIDDNWWKEEWRKKKNKVS